MLPGWTFGPQHRLGAICRPLNNVEYTQRPKSPPRQRFPPLLKSV
jgi:hypothetical protein